MKHPFQLLLLDKAGEHLFVTVKNSIYVFDVNSGTLVGSWVDDKSDDNRGQPASNDNVAQDEATSAPGQERKKVKVDLTNNSVPSKNSKSAPGAPPVYNSIRGLTLSTTEKYLLGTTDYDKALVIFKIDFNKSNCIKLIDRKVFPKRPCAITTTDDDCAALVADKFGDVYEIKLDVRDKVNDVKDPILGHVSMLSGIIFVKEHGKKFIITSDRDEHIRISNYPRSYVIKNFLFGHRLFISQLALPSFDRNLLVSGGGDDFLCLWNWYNGILHEKVDLRPWIEPNLNDSHLPPYAEDNRVKEISVSKILSLARNKNLLIVLCENTSCILVFEVGDDLKTKYVQSLQLRSSIIDISVSEESGLLAVSKDVDSNIDGELVEYFILDKTTTFKKDHKTTQSNKMTESNLCTITGPLELYPLYRVKSLRKRSEF